MTTRRLLGALGAALLLAATPAQGEEQVHVEADDLRWDGAGRTLTASGRVRIVDGDHWIEADEARVHPDRHEVEAKGAVRWSGPDGDGRAEAVELNTETRVGRMTAATIQAPDGSRIHGGRIEQLGPGTFRVIDGSFTPCRCPGDRRPTWAIAAGETTVVADEYVIVRRGRFELLGLPVLWLPWLRAPLVDSRTTGLLIPQLGWSVRYGFRVEPGLFVALGRSADLTVRPRWTSLGGWGAGGEARARSRSGQWSLTGDWFREAADAPFLADENRAAGERWQVRARGRDVPWDIARLTLDIDLVSDRTQGADFAGSLEELARRNATSRLELSREDAAIGASFARLAINQGLLDSVGATGSRLPSLRFLGDPLQLRGIPLTLALDGRFDQFAARDPLAAGRPWEPRTYREEGRRFVVGPTTGLHLDPLPGLQVQAQAGIQYHWRERVLDDSAAVGGRRSFTDEAGWLPWAEGRAWYGLRFRRPGAWLVARPGIDLLWRDAAQEGTAPIEDLDRLRAVRRAAPALRLAGGLGRYVDWDYAHTLPIELGADPAVAGWRVHEAGLGAGDWSLSQRVVHGDGYGLAALDSRVVWRFQPGNVVELGYARTPTDVPAVDALAIRADPFIDDAEVWPGTHDVFANLRYDVWRLWGEVGTRIGLPLGGEPLRWTERRAALGYRGACQCWSAWLGWRDLPGTGGDRIDLRVDLAVIGGFGTDSP